MARDTFEAFQAERLRIDITPGWSEGRPWCLFVGFDTRRYPVFLQQAADEKEPMVRVGCRYETLKGIRKHYVPAGRNWSRRSRKSAAQMLMLIGLAVDTAKTRSLIASTVRFNTTPRKGH